MVRRLIGAMLVIAVATSGLVGAFGPQIPLQEPSAVTAQQPSDDQRTARITIDGSVTPGSDVAITATLAGEPVANADVEINDQFVGETDADGTLRNVAVPDADEFEVDVEAEHVDLKLELEDAALEQAGDRTSTSASVRFGGDLAAGNAVATEVTLADAPVANAVVEVNGDEVGVTDDSGQLTVTVPADDEFELRAKTDDGDVDVEVELEGAALQQAGGDVAAD